MPLSVYACLSASVFVYYPSFLSILLSVCVAMSVWVRVFYRLSASTCLPRSLCLSLSASYADSSSPHTISPLPPHQLVVMATEHFITLPAALEDNGSWCRRRLCSSSSSSSSCFSSCSCSVSCSVCSPFPRRLRSLSTRVVPANKTLPAHRCRSSAASG